MDECVVEMFWCRTLCRHSLRMKSSEEQVNTAIKSPNCPSVCCLFLVRYLWFISVHQMIPSFNACALGTVYSSHSSCKAGCMYHCGSSGYHPQPQTTGPWSPYEVFPWCHTWQLQDYFSLNSRENHSLLLLSPLVYSMLLIGMLFCAGFLNLISLVDIFLGRLFFVAWQCVFSKGKQMVFSCMEIIFLVF